MKKILPPLTNKGFQDFHSHDLLRNYAHFAESTPLNLMENKTDEMESINK